MTAVREEKGRRRCSWHAVYLSPTFLLFLLWLVQKAGALLTYNRDALLETDAFDLVCMRMSTFLRWTTAFCPYALQTSGCYWFREPNASSVRTVLLPCLID